MMMMMMMMMMMHHNLRYQPERRRSLIKPFKRCSRLKTWKDAAASDDDDDDYIYNCKQ
jgi:hypothetical protein